MEKKGRTKEELHTVIHAPSPKPAMAKCDWLTGYNEKGLAKVLADKTDFEAFPQERDETSSPKHLA